MIVECACRIGSADSSRAVHIVAISAIPEIIGLYGEGIQQSCQSFLCGDQNCIILHQRLLRIGQSIIGFPRRNNSRLRLNGNRSNIRNQRIHRRCHRLIICSCHQRCKGVFCQYQNSIVRDPGTLIHRKRIIGSTCLLYYCPVSKRDCCRQSIDQMDQQFALSSCQIVILLHKTLLGIGQGCIACHCSIHSSFVSRCCHAANGVDKSIHFIRRFPIRLCDIQRQHLQLCAAAIIQIAVLAKGIEYGGFCHKQGAVRRICCVDPAHTAIIVKGEINISVIPKKNGAGEPLSGAVGVIIGLIEGQNLGKGHSCCLRVVSKCKQGLRYHAPERAIGIHCNSCNKGGCCQTVDRNCKLAQLLLIRHIIYKDLCFCLGSRRVCTAGNRGSTIKQAVVVYQTNHRLVVHDIGYHISLTGYGVIPRNTAAQQICLRNGAAKNFSVTRCQGMDPCLLIFPRQIQQIGTNIGFRVYLTEDRRAVGSGIKIAVIHQLAVRLTGCLVNMGNSFCTQVVDGCIISCVGTYINMVAAVVAGCYIPDSMICTFTIGEVCPVYPLAGFQVIKYRSTCSTGGAGKNGFAGQIGVINSHKGIHRGAKRHGCRREGSN